MLIVSKVYITLYIMVLFSFFYSFGIFSLQFKFFFKSLDLYRKDNTLEVVYKESPCYVENSDKSICCLCNDSNFQWIANCCFLWKNYAKLKIRKAVFGRLPFLDSSPALLGFCSTLSTFTCPFSLQLPNMLPKNTIPAAKSGRREGGKNPSVLPREK